MAQLGYTWYPQDWWTSETFKRLKRFPMVRYTLRELFDLMYKEGEPVEMNREYLIDDFSIELSDTEFEKLMEYITILEDGKWWIDSIKKRITKAEAARENGRKGGRPKGVKNSKKNHEEKTQKPNEKTQRKNPKNPPLENKRERESKNKIENKKSKPKKEIPELEEFLSYCREIIPEKFEALKFSIEAKYNSWEEAGWKDGHGKVIKTWKTKIRNTIPYLKPFQEKQKDNHKSTYNVPIG